MPDPPLVRSTDVVAYDVEAGIVNMPIILCCVYFTAPRVQIY